jgi:hypothetical protein
LGFPGNIDFSSIALKKWEKDAKQIKRKLEEKINIILRPLHGVNPRMKK